mmetsp:Transcript_34439/g.78279  ORF Transcript_34439/g.78279 Transcript_34439/m.78279 type:complete len:207 (-) Transcript_34439:1293-1913(-)
MVVPVDDAWQDPERLGRLPLGGRVDSRPPEGGRRGLPRIREQAGGRRLHAAWRPHVLAGREDQDDQRAGLELVVGGPQEPAEPSSSVDRVQVREGDPVQLAVLHVLLLPLRSDRFLGPECGEEVLGGALRGCQLQRPVLPRHVQNRREGHPGQEGPRAHQQDGPLGHADRAGLRRHRVGSGQVHRGAGPCHRQGLRGSEESCPAAP